MGLKSSLKISAGTATVIGLIITWLNHLFGPSPIMEPSDYPEVMLWVGLIISSVGIIAYIIIDWVFNKGRD